MKINQSEVARIRQQIALDHAAAKALGQLSSGSARHAIITAKMNRIGAHQLQLAGLIGEQESMAYVCEVFDQ